MNKIQIFCDMDGVLVNFEKGAVDYINSDLLDNSRVPSNLKVDIEKLRKKLLSLGRRAQIDIADLTRDPQKKIIEVRNYMYKRVSDDHNFWADLKWTNDGQKLWRYIKNATPQIIILTAPMPGKGCITGKKAWIEKKLGPDINIIIEEDKFLYSGDNKLLIDDTYSKIRPWAKKGGLIIHHKNTAQTIEQLKLLSL